jgi:hypothetical protein
MFSIACALFCTLFPQLLYSQCVPQFNRGMGLILLPGLSMTGKIARSCGIIDFSSGFARTHGAPEVPATPQLRRERVPHASALRVGLSGCAPTADRDFHVCPASLSARGVPAKLLSLRTTNIRALTDGR